MSWRYRPDANHPSSTIRPTTTPKDMSRDKVSCTPFVSEVCPGRCPIGHGTAYGAIPWTLRGADATMQAVAVAVAQGQSTRLWLWGLRVQVPSATPNRPTEARHDDPRRTSRDDRRRGGVRPSCRPVDRGVR